MKHDLLIECFKKHIVIYLFRRTGYLHIAAALRSRGTCACGSGLFLKGISSKNIYNFKNYIIQWQYLRYYLRREKGVIYKNWPGGRLGGGR